MLGTESLNNNHVNNSTTASTNNSNRINNSNVTQVSCTTTTLIKYKVNIGFTNTTSNNNNNNSNYPNNNESMQNEEDFSSSNNSGLARTTPTLSCPISSTTKTTTTTTFSINNNNNNNNANGSPQKQQSSDSSHVTTTTTTTRPPFITTVTRGKFLPSKFDLMVERSLFTFSSRPRPVNLTKHKHHCCSSTSTVTTTATGGGSSQIRKEESAPTSTTPPRGAHDYYNVMWDPHVVRGSTASTARISDISNKDGKSSGGVSNATEAKIAKANNKRLTTGSTPFKPGTKSRHYNNTNSSSLNYSSTPSPASVPGRRHTMIQTEKYLEQLVDDSVEPLQVHQAIQTEPYFDFPIENDAFSSDQQRFSVQVKYGVDNSTQIFPGELFNFDEEVQPILESMIGKILEQAMFETIEEEEIAALKEEKNRFHEARKQEEKELLELQKEHQRITAQKEQLKRRLEDEQSQKATSSASSSDDYYRFNAMRESESMRKVTTGTSVYTTSYLLELLPSVLNSLRQEGFLTDNVDDDTFSPFVQVRHGSSSRSTLSKEDSGGTGAHSAHENPNEDGDNNEEIIIINNNNNDSSLDQTHVEINYKEENDTEIIELPEMELTGDEEVNEGKRPESVVDHNNYSDVEKELEELSSSRSSTAMTTTSRTQEESQSVDTTTTSTTVTTVLQQQFSSSIDEMSHEF